MSALFMDSFDQYGTGAAGAANMLDGTYAAVSGGITVGSPAWGPSRTGTSNMIMHPVSAGSGQGAFRYVVPGAPSVMFVSFGFAVDFLPPSSTVSFFQTRNGSNTAEYALVLNPTGSISLWHGEGVDGTLVATTAGPVIKAQTWHFIELNVDYSAGSFMLRVDDADATGTPVLTASINTGLVNSIIAADWFNTGAPQFGFYHYDDLFVRNNSGTVNNSWLGDRRVALMMVNADTSTAGWSPSYYKEFGPGVLQLGHITTNNNTPINQDSGYSLAGNSSVDVGSADFTLESFVRFESLPPPTGYSTLFNRWDAANNRRSYRLLLGGSSFNGGNLQFDYSLDGTNVTTAIQYPFTPVLNQWYHIALVRASGELLLFVNGQQLGLPITAGSAFQSGGTSPLCFGIEKGTSTPITNSGLIGLADETRFTNGFARYTSPFAVPVTAFPRGALADPEWADVVLLCGYDSAIVDESSFANTLVTSNGASSFTVTDGPAIGVFSTVNKQIPDDNTFISAALLNAGSILTMTTQPSNGDTVTVGTTDGTNPAVYTWKTAISSAYDVLIDTTATNSLINLFNAINAGAGIGTKYGTGTVANFDVSSSQLPAGQIQAIALTPGTAGNSIATSVTGTAASWTGSTLSGGASIPGPSAFKLSRPPANTTIISAVQASVRASKTDSGSASIQSSFVGPLGTAVNGATHNLTISPDFYLDMFETDPDTGQPISPSTIISGQLQINRTA